MEAELLDDGSPEREEQALVNLFEQQYFGCFGPEMPFEAYIDQLCTQAGKKRWQVIHRAWIDRTYGYQLFNGTRKPSRDKAIQLAIGFELNVDQTQELLRAAEKNTLEPRKKRDAAVLFCLAREMDVENTQKLLERHELEPLGQFER